MVPDGDLPKVILYQNNFEAAVLCALENYKNDTVLFFNEGELDLSFVQSHGWKVSKWKDFLDSKDDGRGKINFEKKTSNQKMKKTGDEKDAGNTIIFGDTFEGLAGIEVKNVIFFSEHLNEMVIGEFNKRDSNSTMDFAIKLILFRAVAHLTVIMKDFSAEPLQPHKNHTRAATLEESNRKLAQLKIQMQRQIDKAMKTLEIHARVTHLD